MNILRLALHPIPELAQSDTSLRYTDILFGFVIKELFIRIQNWSQLTGTVRLHLIVGTVLVLGSWIGFRRSLTRPRYEVKFFNLPLFMFIIDQMMLIVYFRVATLTKAEGSGLPTPDGLAINTSNLVFYIFVLYVAWDLLGLWMKKTYPRVDNTMTRKPAALTIRDAYGLFISASGTILLLPLWQANMNSNCLLFCTGAVMVGYRWAKEIRTSSDKRTAP